VHVWVHNIFQLPMSVTILCELSTHVVFILALGDTREAWERVGEGIHKFPNSVTKNT